MAGEEMKIVVAAPTFQSAFHIAMHDNLKKWLASEEVVLRSVTDDTNTQKERLMRTIDQVNPSALIAISVRPDSETIAAYTAANVPIVLIDEETTGVSTITTDNFLGGRLAGSHLIKTGKKNIAIVSGRTQVKGGYNAEQRVKGCLEALQAGKISVPPQCLIEVLNYSREDGIEVMPKLLDMKVDAIFCAAGDNCALGLVTVARDRGVKIPDDVAIIGFDDLLIAQLSTPRLTTIKQPLEKMAEAAYNMAVVQREEILHKPQKAIFSPELIIRQSA